MREMALLSPASTGHALCAVLGSACPLGITLQNSMPQPVRGGERKIDDEMTCGTLCHSL